MTRLLLAAALAAAAALPAAAQSRLSQAELAQLERTHDGNLLIQAPGLPGVALDATTTTDRPSGPGGLSNGVGATGTLMPNSSSSNGQLLDDEVNGFGFSLDNPRVIND